MTLNLNDVKFICVIANPKRERHYLLEVDEYSHKKCLNMSSMLFWKMNQVGEEKEDEEAMERRLKQINRRCLASSVLKKFKPQDWEDFKAPCMEEFRVERGNYDLRHRDMPYLPTLLQKVMLGKQKWVLEYLSTHTGTRSINKIAKHRASSCPAAEGARGPRW